MQNSRTLSTIFKTGIGRRSNRTFRTLEARDLTDANVIDWLTDWAKLNNLIGETYSRLYVGTTVDTTDEATEQRFQRLS